MATVLPLRTAWTADILSPASLCDVQRWKRGSRDGQRLWDYGTTERSFNFVSALCVAVERVRFDAHHKPSAKPSAAADSEKRKFVRGFFADSHGQKCQSFRGKLAYVTIERVSTKKSKKNKWRRPTHGFLHLNLKSLVRQAHERSCKLMSFLGVKRIHRNPDRSGSAEDPFESSKIRGSSDPKKKKKIASPGEVPRTASRLV